MRREPKRIPQSLVFQKFLYSFLRNCAWIIAKSSKGKKRIFICSQVDSFTAEKGAREIQSVHSYKKCKIVPKTETKVKPIKNQSDNDFFITLYYTPKKLFVCKRRKIFDFIAGI